MLFYVIINFYKNYFIIIIIITIIIIGSNSNPASVTQRVTYDQILLRRREKYSAKAIFVGKGWLEGLIREMEAPSAGTQLGYMIGGVTRQGGVKFCHVNISRWGNPPNRDRIRNTSYSRTIGFGGGFAALLTVTI